MAETRTGPRLAGHPSAAKTAMAAPRILTVNGGSSSIKFAVYPVGAGKPDDRPELSGSMEGIGTHRCRLKAVDAASRLICSKKVHARNHHHAAKVMVEFLRATLLSSSISAVGHRVVHGGIHLNRHTRITAGIIRELKQSVPLDMAHLPREIILIESMIAAYPGAMQVACLDTAFHRTLPPVARLYAIPRKFARQGLRRYGFHGLSYSFLMEELWRMTPAKAKGRVILAHLGSGASMAAVSNGRPVDTTMGFTPVAGLVMATRPGDLDPGLLVHLMRRLALSPAAAERFINEDCGLKAVSGRTGDMRDLHRLARRDAACREAVALFCRRARGAIGALAAEMGGLDILVFSGGIGENDAMVRRSICRNLDFLGVRLASSANNKASRIVSRPGSRVLVCVIPTDEEKMIAAIVRRHLRARRLR